MYFYHGELADFARKREWGGIGQRIKLDIILENLGDCDRLLDIGCGSGPILHPISKRISKTFGIDESLDRLLDAKGNCSNSGLSIAKADKLPFLDKVFDVVLTSQMLHEVKLFGSPPDLISTLFEIRRVLKPKGRYFLLDHLDPGEGEVEIKIAKVNIPLLEEFRDKFEYHPVHLKWLGSDTLLISRRDLQDFVTKTWSLNSPMEKMEMTESHTTFSEEELRELIKETDLVWEDLITFHSIEIDLNSHHITLLKENHWNRKFLLIASRPI